MDNNDNIEEKILELFQEQGRPLARPVIEAEILTNTGFSATDVTNGLASLCDSGSIIKTQIPGYTGSFGLEATIFSLERPDSSELDRFAELFRQKHALNPHIGRAAEQYLRSVLWASRRYREITQTERLGRLDLGDYLGDLTAVNLDNPHIGQVLFEVKNQREVFYPTSRLFGKLIASALHPQIGQPALAVVSLSAQARVYCAELGIAALEFQRRIYPSRLRSSIQRLRDVIGPAPEEYFYLPQPFRRGKSTAVRRDIATVSDPLWLYETNQRWRANRQALRRYAWAIEHEPNAALIRELRGVISLAA